MGKLAAKNILISVSTEEGVRRRKQGAKESSLPSSLSAELLLTANGEETRALEETDKMIANFKRKIKTNKTAEELILLSYHRLGNITYFMKTQKWQQNVEFASVF